ncbi:MAG: GHMP kinase, partial [Clostridia bacterium]|nr:GHMP kinase [Clostridia bacterium]
MDISRQKVIDEFEKKYRKEPMAVSFTPYRVCPIGAHSDHNLGRITGFAIDRGVYIAYGPKQNGVVEISSLQFAKRAQWHVRATPEKKEGDWADHLRGATIALNKRYPLNIGLCGVINGELPIGGLSSSAAVIITFLSALCKLNGISLSASELIDVSREAENLYVGVASGKLDQSCEIYCKKDSLLYMDMLDNSHEVIPMNPATKPFDIMIFFSGLERTLATTTFNNRVDEAKSADYAVMAFNGHPEKSFSAITLRDVPR